MCGEWGVVSIGQVLWGVWVRCVGVVHGVELRAWVLWEEHNTNLYNFPQLCKY